MGILKNVGRAFAIAGLCVSLVFGTMSFIAAGGTLIAHKVTKKKSLEEFKMTQEYEDLKDGELQKIKTVRDGLTELEERFENGEMTSIEYQTQADEINKQLTNLETNLDSTLFEQSQNPATIQARKKLKNMEIASAVLTCAYLGTGVGKFATFIAINIKPKAKCDELLHTQILDAVYSLSYDMACDIEEANERRNERSLQRKMEKLKKQEEKIKKLKEKVKQSDSF